MKKLILFLAIVSMIGCNSDDDSGDVTTNDFEQIKTLLPQGTWEVSKFVDDNQDRTLDFGTFIFTFSTNGTVIAENDLFSEDGTWQYKQSNKDEELELQFNGTTPFEEISREWKIVSVDNSKIELTEVNDNGSTDTLVFSKI